MRRFFSFITCIVITAGCSVSDNGIVNVKKRDNFSLIVRTPEMKIVSRVTVRKRNGTQEVFRHCSREEQNHGCKPFNSERTTLQIGNEAVCVTLLDASTRDEGVYDVEVIDNKSIRICRNFTVALTG
ncbi:Endolytic peptidoglycan transglycosylase RlpA [Labeo rohita]|uniref:Endolytic peptidoglycan transglycosylase RlpA n=1 Tax=Labeo rohita TaxID=84645 RepID=A0ABQ8LYX2_LABRO|nr:Endolytic peptidoglycan transglycosylase RlpA [Labeo rohita]